MLTDHQHPVVPIGIKSGTVAGQEIQNLHDQPEVTDVDTVTLYIGPRHQPEWYDYILGLNPQRIIFNPGTENSEFSQQAQARGHRDRRSLHPGHATRGKLLGWILVNGC